MAGLRLESNIWMMAITQLWHFGRILVYSKSKGTELGSSPDGLVETTVSMNTSLQAKLLVLLTVQRPDHLKIYIYTGNFLDISDTDFSSYVWSAFGNQRILFE